MKIIYVFERRHAYNYDCKMFQYDVFRNHGHLIEVWSAINWTFTQKIDIPVNHDDSSYVHYINNEYDLEKELERVKNEECLFLCYPYHAYNYISYLIRKNIKKHGFAFCNITESPELCWTNNRLSAKINLLTIFKLCIRYLLSSIKNLVLCRFFRLKNVFFAFWGPLIYKSKKNFITVPIMYHHYPNIFEYFSNRNILLHSESFDEFIEIKNNDIMDNSKREYVVFIDQYDTGHSDFKKLGMNYPITDGASYFSQLCYLFDKIEEKFGYEVIIAAHPKAEYAGNEFGDRSILYGKTNKLIIAAKFVIIQHSTVFGLVCLSKKPFLNICSNEMFKNVPSLKEDYIAIMNVFGNGILDISDEHEVDLFSKYIFFDEEKYKTYLDFYVISNESVYNNCLFYQAIYKELFEDGESR